MARKPSTNSQTPTTEAEVTSTEESTVTTTTEAPVEAVATEAPAAAEVEIDLSDFNTALAAAVSGADESTGDVPEALIEPVVLAYRRLDGVKAKNAAKRQVDEAMKSAMDDSNIPVARANLQVSKKLTAGPTSSGQPRAERTPVDPTESFVELAAGLSLASQLVQGLVPEGVSEDWTEKVQSTLTDAGAQAQAYLAWVNTETPEGEDAPAEPEVPAFVKAAVKLALGKSAKVGSTRKASTGGSTYEGERRDVGKHITEAFESVESGTFLTIAEIRKHESAEYGKDAPSAGAISARLFPKSGKVSVEGVTPSTNDKGIKGATKN